MMELRNLFLVLMLLLAGHELAFAQRPSPDIPRRGNGNPIPGRFVVTLQERADPRVVARENGIEPEFVYTRVLVGFAGPMSEAARSGLLRDNRVVRVEQDREARARQTGVTWGLDRIDQRALPLSGTFSPGVTGRGVTVYVVDTGIRFDHVEFGGRAIRGIDTVNDGQNGYDCDGHGTHVAGTIGGRSYGVARETTLVAARVLNCEGSGAMSGIIYALDWIASNGRRPGVVNMSLGGDAYASLDDAIRRLSAYGFPVVVAAGNDGADACLYSPSRARDAITVAASDRNDARASFSNYGSCVDIFAPGASITSAYNTSSTALASASGTSMASPHVAGVAALILQSQPSLTAAGVADAIRTAATTNVISGPAGSPNSLLYTQPATAAAPAPEPLPSPTPTTPAPSNGGVSIQGTSGNDVITPSQTVSGQPLPTNGNDVISGLAGNDQLDGGGGGDWTAGGTGNDIFAVDNAGDVVVETLGEGDDSLSASISYTLPAGTSIETFGTTNASSTAAISLTGNELPNSIYGNAGPNTLNGGGGADYLVGLGGNDVHVVDNAGDNIAEQSGQGDDRLVSSVSYRLGATASVETMGTINASGTAAINLTGNDYPQSIYGNAGANVLSGDGSGDYLVGLEGNDVLIGGGGADVLDGGAGNDEFRFDAIVASYNADRIVDFTSGQDRIALDDSVFTGLAAGSLQSAAFRMGAAAVDADDRIIYDQASGTLYFDRDGSGSAAAVPFARVAAGTAIGASDFTVF